MQIPIFPPHIIPTTPATTTHPTAPTIAKLPYPRAAAFPICSTDSGAGGALMLPVALPVADGVAVDFPWEHAFVRDDAGALGMEVGEDVGAVVSVRSVGR